MPVAEDAVLDLGYEVEYLVILENDLGKTRVFPVMKTGLRSLDAEGVVYQYLCRVDDPRVDRWAVEGKASDLLLQVLEQAGKHLSPLLRSEVQAAVGR